MLMKKISQTEVIKIFFLFVALLFLISFISFSQTKSEIKKEIDKIVQEARNGNSLLFNTGLISDKFETWILDLIEPYYSDTMIMVRSKVYDIAKTVGMQSADINTRRKVANILLQACKDKNSGISGMASQSLTYFNKTDFNEQAGKNLADLLNCHPAHYTNIIKLVGFVQPTDAENILLYIIATDSTLNPTTRWAIHMALARIGNKEQIAYCVNKVKNIAVNDSVVYDLLPDLIYIRQPEAIDYLIEVLNSDEKNCSSPDPDFDEKILCGYRVMEYLAPIIKNFPLQVGASGDIKGYSYPDALEIARKWFEENKEYELIKYIY